VIDPVFYHGSGPLGLHIVQGCLYVDICIPEIVTVITAAAKPLCRGTPTAVFTCRLNQAEGVVP